ncbi:hypothetical protein A0J61_04851 [Choanephora cucurbitarum]|uniref:VWFA domain-containing protein n=1 Tax=Choanephora cucurbitarum TaxID=101091 RepID=A0A1C7NIC1_9FUNG|nr:hypothetical protein A0J61_04851 [Choanephora cucurbitarum]
MSSFATYPASLPFFKDLHDEELLGKLILELGQDKLVNDTSKLDISERKHPFMDAYEKKANETLTTNGGLTNASTLDPIIDLFYGYDTVKTEGRNQMYEAAWKADPMMTLRIIFYGRSIHRGKSLTSAFYTAFCWLLINHPRTALANLHMLIDGKVRTDAQLQYNRVKKAKKVRAEKQGWDMVDEEDNYKLLDRRDYKTHGYWKDLCSILTIYAQGELEGHKNSEYLALAWPRMEHDRQAHKEKKAEIKRLYEERKNMSPEGKAKYREEADRKTREKNETKKAKAKEDRYKTRAERNERSQLLLKNDKKYRALHFTIARLFAKQLKADIEQLETNKKMLEEGKLSGRHALGFNLSLAAKWAPSLGNSHDKHTFLATSIAEVLFPPETYQDKEETREHYLNEARDRYRKQYLIPLRNALDLIDHYKQPGHWEQVDISHMPSKCLQKELGLFFRHAPETVMKYMDELSQGKRKVSGATLGPHELVHRFRTRDIDDNLRSLLQQNAELYEKFSSMKATTINAQWDTLIKSIRETSLLNCDDSKKSKKVDLGDCLAICDVSGSMFSGNDPKYPEMAPFNAAIGLSLVITNLAKPPFNGAIITFSAEPEMFKVNTSAKFTDQVEEVMACDAGFNTDLAKVFTDVLLPMAKEHKIKPEDMVKRLFIFTDMNFDACDNGGDKLMKTHDFICKQYQDSGYEVPEIVWWNLCSAKEYMSPKKMNTPIDKDDLGITLLSGFSSAMIKAFFDGEAEEEEDEEENEEGDENESKQKEKKGPMDFIRKSVCHESFDGLVIID